MWRKNFAEVENFCTGAIFVDNTSHICSDKNAKVQKHRNTKQKYKTTLFCTGVSPLMLSPHVFQLLGVYLLWRETHVDKIIESLSRDNKTHNIVTLKLSFSPSVSQSQCNWDATYKEIDSQQVGYFLDKQTRDRRQFTTNAKIMSTRIKKWMYNCCRVLSVMFFLWVSIMTLAQLLLIFAKHSHFKMCHNSNTSTAPMDG